jgi:hypothetical protein
MRLVPEAKSVRTHALVQSTPILQEIVRATPVRVDVSLYLPRVYAAPFTFDLDVGALTRVPYQWEDDFEMAQSSPVWDPSAIADDSSAAPLVVDFHPIHIFLNSAKFENYVALKAVRARLTDVTPADISPFVHRGIGTASAFDSALTYAEQTEARGLLIRELDVGNRVVDA